MTEPLVRVESLSVSYRSAAGVFPILHDVSFGIGRGEVFGLVGESGSGKSTLAYHLTAFCPPGSRVEAGHVTFAGHDLLGLGPKALQNMRGRRIGFVPQNPTTALSPSLRVGTQIGETMRAHGAGLGQRLEARIAELFGLVGLPDPRRIGGRFPHELSGGQQQRAAIAMALACNPDFVILDEPTTGLDVTTQRQIIALLTDLQKRIGLSMLYVTHDLALLAQIADRIGVMYHGRLVEVGEAATLLHRPQHDYTRRLIGATSRLRPEVLPGTEADTRVEAAPLLALDCLQLGYGRRQFFGRRRGSEVTVVPSLSFDMRAAEILALVGESGSGKSTVARAICGRLAPMAGTIRFLGAPLAPRCGKRPGADLRSIQYIFQNPDASLNPRMTVRQILMRPIRQFQIARGPAVEPALVATMTDVRLPQGHLDRYPDQLSGGERQRVAIARALIALPKLLVCDEILSSLDVSVQASIIALLRRLRDERGLSILFISHDLAVVQQLADRVAVLYRGEIMQKGRVSDVYREPSHPYTRMLLEAAPTLVRDTFSAESPRLPGPPPPVGLCCPLAGRCPIEIDAICRNAVAPVTRSRTGMEIRCHASKPSER